jgi:hypothetical protein
MATVLKEFKRLKIKEYRSSLPKNSTYGRVVSETVVLQAIMTCFLYNYLLVIPCILRFIILQL